MRLPITRRLFIGLILLPALTLGVSTWFSYDQTSRTVDQLVDSTSQTALKQLEQSFSRIIDDTKKIQHSLPDSLPTVKTVLYRTT